MKIITTIGPASENIKDLKKIINYSSIIRLNGSHNDLIWHKSIIENLKKIDPNITILFDIPGIKPRTLNEEIINIKKFEKVIFYYKNVKSIKENFLKIKISNQLPKINKVPKFFSIDDGLYYFKILEYNKNFIIGESVCSFQLNLKKGLNINGGEYDDKIQYKKYINFINKVKKFKIDAIGLSYIQDPEVIRKIKKRFDNLVIVSKIENKMGMKNINDICNESDVLMIDRGDLAAEIGIRNLYSAILKITSAAKKKCKPIIMATENLKSMMHNNIPSKSDLIAIEHSKSLGTDCIMLSEETATNKKFLKILSLLYQLTQKGGLKTIKRFDTSILNIDFLFNNLPLIIISRKGYILEKAVQKLRNTQNIYLTSDSYTYHKSVFYKNFKSVFLGKLVRNKFDSYYIFSIIKKFKKQIFKNSNIALIIHTVFPKKNIRANSISVVNKRDFN